MVDLISEAKKNDLFRNYTISNLVDFVQSGKLSHFDPYKCAEKRYSLFNSQFHAFKSVYSEAEAVSMRTDSHPVQHQPLSSMPFGIKDIFNTTLHPTGMGSSIWERFEAGNNARCIDSLLRHGALPFGKTVTAEFAVHALNETLNPYDPSCTPGTSSSGSAVAVATGIIPFSIGTQTAASIIRPASFCGVWGMKPSFGLIPRTGSLKTTDSLDTVGFFCFFGSDLRRVLSTLRVRGPNYPYIYTSLDKRGPFPKPKGHIWRVGVFKSAFWEASQLEIVNSIESTISMLESDSNIEINFIPDYFGLDVHSDHSVIYDKSLSYYFQEEALAQDQISSLIADAIERGSMISPSSYQEALDRQSDLMRKSAQLFGSYDVIISLSTSTTAPKRHEIESPDPSLIWTYLGMPAIHAPTGLSNDNMPIGFQLCAKRFDDYVLLQFLDYVFQKGYLSPSSLKTDFVH